MTGGDCVFSTREEKEEYVFNLAHINFMTQVMSGDVTHEIPDRVRLDTEFCALVDSRVQQGKLLADLVQGKSHFAACQYVKGQLALVCDRTFATDNGLVKIDIKHVTHIRGENGKRDAFLAHFDAIQVIV